MLCLKYNKAFYTMKEIYFLLSRPVIGETDCLKNVDADLLIVTVAFNNPVVIEYQIKTLRKNLQDSYVLMIVDNSTAVEASLSIQRICEHNNIIYIKLPKNYYSYVPKKLRMHSYSHGMAVNYVWYRLLNKYRGWKYIGFLDHDVFLVKKFSVSAILSKYAVYGRKIQGKNGNYIWAGLLFTQCEVFQNKMKFNYKPYRGNDTAGRFLWEKIYDIHKIKYTTYQLMNINENKGVEHSSYHTDKYELFDDCWLHAIDSSHWKAENPQKDRFIITLLNQMLAKEGQDE